MATYNYKCDYCNLEVEVELPMKDVEKRIVPCAKCAKVMKKVLTLPTLIGFDNIGRSIK
jgi:putative FmdB family regulatory protein